MNAHQLAGEHTCGHPDDAQGHGARTYNARASTDIASGGPCIRTFIDRPSALPQRGTCMTTSASNLQQVQADIDVRGRGRHHHIAAGPQAVHAVEARVGLRWRAAQRLRIQVRCHPEARRVVGDVHIAPAGTRSHYAAAAFAACTRVHTVFMLQMPALTPETGIISSLLWLACRTWALQSRSHGCQEVQSPQGAIPALGRGTLVVAACCYGPWWQGWRRSLVVGSAVGHHMCNWCLGAARTVAALPEQLVSLLHGMSEQSRT